MAKLLLLGGAEPISQDEAPTTDPICLQGDSRGPLVCNKVTQGVVSFGYDSLPGVYARIANYRRWMKKIMTK